MSRRCSVPWVLWLTGTLLAVGVSAVGYRVWEGEPYPAVVPDQVAERLKGEAQRVYEEVALPGRDRKSVV